MDKYVTSLEISLRLKELGVKQKSEFVWGQRKYPDSIRKNSYFKPDLFYGGEDRLKVLCSAFLASELAEMLPEVVGKMGEEKHGGLTISKYKEAYAVWYCSAKDRTSIFGSTLTFFEDRLPDALGKMLIYLIENHLLTLPQDTTAGGSS